MPPTPSLQVVRAIESPVRMWLGGVGTRDWAECPMQKTLGERALAPIAVL